MTPPKPPTRKLKAPPAPKKRRTPPPPPRNEDMVRFEREDSFIRAFVEGDFEKIPEDVIDILREYCRYLGKGKLSIVKGTDALDVKGAIFAYTDFPYCTWRQASEQLRNKIIYTTPFSAISTRCLEWLRKECDYNAARYAAKGV